MDKKQIRKMREEQRMSIPKIVRLTGLTRNEVENMLADKKGLAGNGKVLFLLVAIVGIIFAGTVGIGIPRKAEPKRNEIAVSQKAEPAENELWLDSRSPAIQNFFNERAKSAHYLTARVFEKNDMRVFAPFIHEKEAWIEQAYKTGASIPEVAATSRVFSGKTALAVYHNGNVMFLATSKAEKEKAGNHAMVLLFFTHDEPAPDVQEAGSDFFYDHNDGLVNIAIDDYSKLWFQTIALHELYHATRASNWKTLPGGSLPDGYASEEITAHGIQRDYLNIVTHGAYEKTIAKVLGQLKDTSSVRELWGNLTTENLDEIDRVFGKCYSFESQVRASQYLFDLAHYWTLNHVPKDQLKKAEITFYKQYKLGLSR